MAKKHAKNSPSAAHRWLEGGCSGSTTLNQIVAQVESPYAVRGTHAHALIEYCLKHDIWTALKAPKETRKTLNGEDISAVQYFLDYVFMHFSLLGKDAYLLSESKCSVEKYLPDCYGTLDVVMWNKHRVSVIDYKHGSGVFVPIKDNPQLLIYLLGTWLRLRNQVDVDAIWEIGIIQPRCDHKGPKTRFQKITLKELNEFSKKLVEYNENFDPFRFVPGEHCHWCTGSTICPVLIQKSIEVMHAAQIENVDPNDLGIIQWVLVNRDIIRSFLKDVENRALHVQRHGVQIEGFKLVRQTKRAKWIYDNSKMVQIFRREANAEQFNECTEIKPNAISQVQKVLGKEFTKEYTYIPDGDTVLVPVSDERPEVGAFADFED